MASSHCVILVIVAWISATSCTPAPPSKTYIEIFNETENQLRTDNCSYPPEKLWEELRPNCVMNLDTKNSYKHTVCIEILQLGVQGCHKRESNFDKYINAENIQHDLKADVNICSSIQAARKEVLLLNNQTLLEILQILSPLLNDENCGSTCKEDFGRVCRLLGVTVFRLLHALNPNLTQWLKPPTEPPTASKTGEEGSSSVPDGKNVMKEGTSDNHTETTVKALVDATPSTQALLTTSLAPAGAPGQQSDTKMTNGSKSEVSKSTAAPTAKPEGGYPTAAPTAKPEGGYPTAAPTAKPEGGYPTAGPTAKPEGGYPTAGPTAKPEGGYPTAGPTAKPEDSSLTSASTTNPKVNNSTAVNVTKPGTDTDLGEPNPTRSEAENRHDETPSKPAAGSSAEASVENANPSGKETTTRLLNQENGGSEKTGDGQAFEEGVETESSGHFMAYFLTAVVLCIAGYVIFHNKQKIIAFIVEGRGGRQRRRLNGAEYKKLQSNVEEVMPALDKTTAAKNFIY